MKTKRLIFLSLSLMTISFAANSITYFVRTNGNNSSNGLSVETAFLTLDKAFNNPALADGDVIDIVGEFEYNRGKALSKSIILKGEGVDKSIVKGVAGVINNCFNLGLSNNADNNPKIIIQDITFQNFNYYDSNAAKSGGAIYVHPGTTLICQRVHFINNQSYIGGAVNIGGGNATFEDCYFAGNKSLKLADGIYADGGAVNVNFVSQSQKESIVITRCLFENNSTEANGAALRLKIDGEQFKSAVVSNSTFTLNKITAASGRDGSTIYVQGNATNADVRIINNTIAYNTSEKTTSSAKAGLYIYGLNQQVILKNNIFFSNFNSEETPKTSSIAVGYDINLKESKNNITDVATSVFDFKAKTPSGNVSGNISSVTADKLMLSKSLESNGGATKTLAISGKSVALNAGVSSFEIPIVDQRNAKKINISDVGAFEVDAIFEK